MAEKLDGKVSPEILERGRALCRKCRAFLRDAIPAMEAKGFILCKKCKAVWVKKEAEYCAVCDFRRKGKTYAPGGR